MFLSSFEKLRTHLLDTMQIDNMLHLGPRTFDELSGEVVQNTAFVLTKHAPTQTGTYYRLVDGKNCGDKERMFLAGEHYYPHVSQQNFKKIPGCPIGYWVSEAWLKVFFGETLKDKTIFDGQTKTGDNNKYLRFLWEVSSQSIGKEAKWVKHPKGGGFRKWYGNLDTVIDWSIEAREHYRKDKVARILPQYLWWRKGVCWNLICSSKQSFRVYNDDEIFNLAAPTLFFKMNLSYHIVLDCLTRLLQNI